MDGAKTVVSAPHWEHFAHGADIGVRGIGRTKEQAFEQAAMALMAVITDPKQVGASIEISIEQEAGDSEVLLVDWLNALVYEMAVRELIFGRFTVRIEGNRLYGLACGETLEPARHQPAVEVKGATYTSLAVQQRPDGNWVAQCVVDV